MSVRAVYTECSCQPWFEVAEILQARQGWKPIYWTGHTDCRGEVEARFPDAIFHDNYDAVRGIAPAACESWPLKPVDARLLRDLAPYETIVMRMMDRMDPDDSFTYSQRVRVYERLVTYWLSALTQMKPDVLVFPCAPHLCYDYVLYAIAKQLGIPTLLVKETYVGGLIFSQPSFEETSPELLREHAKLAAGYQTGTEVELWERSNAYVEKVRGNHDTATPYYLKEFYRAYGTAQAEAAAAGAANASGTGARAGAAAPLTEAWTDLKLGWAELKKSYAEAKEQYRTHEEMCKETAAQTWELCKTGRQDPGPLVKMIAKEKFAIDVVRLFENHGLDHHYAGLTMGCMQAAFAALAPSLRERKLDAESFREAMELALHFYENLDHPAEFVMAPPPRQYFVRRGEDHLQKDRMGGLEYRLYRRLAEAKKNALNRYYHDLAVKPDLTKPFIYFALNYQPEQTTSPEGGVFVYQYLAVRMLSQLMPEGWRIYVKDHPVQLHPVTSGESSRWEGFYQDLADLPGVALVPLDFSTFQLIDAARAVATVNGTAVWESVVRGKPALAFGHVWYHACEGVFHVPSAQACAEALKRIQEGYRPDYQKVRLFIRALEVLGYRACSLPESLEFAGLTQTQSAEGMVKAILSMAAASGKVQVA
jgi:hypothetical protein